MEDSISINQRFFRNPHAAYTAGYQEGREQVLPALLLGVLGGAFGVIGYWWLFG